MVIQPGPDGRCPASQFQLDNKNIPQKKPSMRGGQHTCTTAAHEQKLERRSDMTAPNQTGRSWLPTREAATPLTSMLEAPLESAAGNWKNILVDKLQFISCRLRCFSGTLPRSVLGDDLGSCSERACWKQKTENKTCGCTKRDIRGKQQTRCWRE